MEGSEPGGRRSDHRDAGEVSAQQAWCWLEARHPVFWVPAEGIGFSREAVTPALPDVAAAP